MVRAKQDTKLVLVVIKHHPLVRLSHWLNVPLLLGLIASGLSIYRAAPVFPARPESRHRNARVRPRRRTRGRDDAPRSGRGGWIYDHFSLGIRQLALSLRFHWALAYLFMLNGALYAIGLAAGGGWRALLPRRTDVSEALAMIRFYLGVIPMALLRRGRIRRYERSTTRSSAPATCRCRSSPRWPSCRAGPCTSPCSSAGSNACS
jgi:hypothetical protein